MAKRCQAILTDRSQHGYRFASKPGGSSFRAVGKCLLELLSNPEFWALNSAVECHLHTVEVIGSNPIAPTIFPLRFLVTRSLTALGISPAGSRPQNGSSSYSAHQLPQGFVFRIREFSFAPSRRCELDVPAEGCPKCCVHRGSRCQLDRPFR